MPDIVIGASCLIDMRKGGLLVAICNLACGLVIPAPVRTSDVLTSRKNIEAIWTRAG